MYSYDEERNRVDCLIEARCTVIAGRSWWSRVFRKLDENEVVNVAEKYLHFVQGKPQGEVVQLVHSTKE